MCLLDEVMHYDERAIASRATSHQSAGNPLRHEGRLPALAGIEYAAQALAHCALSARHRSARGPRSACGVRARRASIVSTTSTRLDVRAERLIADGPRFYTLQIQAGGRELLSGRVAVALRKEEAG
jgi:predicted hotdog family 3-hydroxylacyl-ACP dehydratase